MSPKHNQQSCDWVFTEPNAAKKIWPNEVSDFISHAIRTVDNASDCLLDTLLTSFETEFEVDANPSLRKRNLDVRSLVFNFNVLFVSRLLELCSRTLSRRGSLVVRHLSSSGIY